MLTTLSDAKELATGLLVSRGLSSESADRSAWAMVTADAWGKGSHGLLRLGHYLRRLDAGGIDPHAIMTVVKDTGPLIAFDGNEGMGHYQAYRASEFAVEKAKEFGVSLKTYGVQPSTNSESITACHLSLICIRTQRPSKRV